MTDDRRDDETRMRDVPDDDATRAHSVPDDQATPPSTQQQHTPPSTPQVGQETTAAGQVPPPPPPPPGYEHQTTEMRPTQGDDQATRIGQYTGQGDQTTVGNQQVDERSAPVGGDGRDQTTQAAVVEEPRDQSEGSGDMEDYQWHTGQQACLHR